ncbi:fimbria/pilus periplasmic chaperone [Escherichia coli]
MHLIKRIKAKRHFTVIPPVSQLEPAQEKYYALFTPKVCHCLMIARIVFSLNIKNIPPSASNKATNSLEIAVKTRIELFWRPANIRLIPEDAAPKVKWRRKGEI